MSAKFDQQIYKVYEPAYHSRGPIIVDESVESPDTLTIRLEEEAARASGGDFGGDSPTGLVGMSAYKPQPPQLQGYADSPYSQYSPQSYSSHHGGESTAQISPIAFASGNAESQYMDTSSSTAPNVHVLSCHPSVGSYRTQVSLSVSSQFDLFAVTSGPYAYVFFGPHKCPAHIGKESRFRGGTHTCTVTADAPAPQYIQTSFPSLSNVPLTLLVVNGAGEELARVDGAGTFSYHNDEDGSRGSTGIVSAEPRTPHEDASIMTRGESPARAPGSPRTIPIRATNTTHSTSAPTGIPSDANTNTYGYPPSAADATATAHADAQAQEQSNFDAAGDGEYNQANNTDSMLGTYRGTSFSDHYPRAPPALRSPRTGGWATYGGLIDPYRDSYRGPATTIAHSSHTAISRTGLTPLSQATPGVPQLVRTSTLSSTGGVGSGGYNTYGLFTTKATLKILGDLDSMARDWSNEEYANRRRLVVFKKQQQGSQITTSFRAVPLNDRPPHSICISCIYWEERKECFVTSVDTIHLLEQLVVAPSRFTVEEKNRIRRNLEGFHPLTVSKAKAETEEFFKVIMGFGNPKPRNIEKDVKVFPWKILSQALKKIISKYSSSPSSTLPPSTPTQLLTPVSLSSSYSSLPPAPGPATTMTDTTPATGYVTHHADSGTSPRSLSGSSSWGAYAASRTLSPRLKASSPVPSSGLHISTLPAIYDTRGTAHSLTSPYGIHTPAHHSPHHSQPSYSQSGYSQSSYSPSALPVTQSHTRSWHNYPVTDSYSSHSAHAHSHGHHVYGTGMYGERA